MATRNLTNLLAFAILIAFGWPLYADAETGRANEEANTSSCIITIENAPEVELAQTLSGHTDGAWTVVFSPDGSLMASGAQDGRIIVRPVDNLSSTTVLTGGDAWVVGLAFGPDGQLLASGGSDGFSGSSGPIRLWDIPTSTQTNVLPAHTGGVWSLDFQESSGTLVSGSLDGTVKLWNPFTSSLLNTLHGHSGPVLSVDFSPTQDLIASSGIDRDIWLWNSQNGDSVNVLEGHTNNIGFVKFSPSGLYLASSADDETVRLWEVATGTQLWSKRAEQGWVNCVNFSPDGNLLLTCGHNGSVVLRETATGNELRRLEEHTQPVLRGAFHPNGAVFATASWDRTVRLWAIPTSFGSTNHTPAEPTPDDSVLVLSQLSDCGGISNVSLHYDLGDGFQTVPMFDNGDHGYGSADDLTFGAKILPAPLASSVQYYVSVTDHSDSTIVDPVGAPAVCYEYTVSCCEGLMGNVDCEGIVDIGDVTELIALLFIRVGDSFCCEDEADLDYNGDIDIGDLTILINRLFISVTDPPPCP